MLSGEVLTSFSLNNRAKIIDEEKQSSRPRPQI